MTGPYSPQLERYLTLGQAIADGDTADMRRQVDPTRFTALLPGTGTLSYNEYVREIERLHTAFSDFGRNVGEPRTVEEGHTLAIYYSMTVTHDGPLYDGRGNSLQPTGKTITFTSMDMVRFDPTSGLIVELTVVSDRMSTTEQLAG